MGRYLFQLYSSNKLTGFYAWKFILVSFPMRFGELTIQLFHNNGKYEYENSRKLASSTQLIKDLYQVYSVSESQLTHTHAHAHAHAHAHTHTQE